MPCETCIHWLPTGRMGNSGVCGALSYNISPLVTSHGGAIIETSPIFECQLYDPTGESPMRFPFIKGDDFIVDRDTGDER